MLISISVSRPHAHNTSCEGSVDVDGVGATRVKLSIITRSVSSIGVMRKKVSGVGESEVLRKARY
jgi:hypothetical protein